MTNKLLPLLCLLSASCTTARATWGPVPKERALECVLHCEELGMKLSAVVIISSSAGCVCEPKDADAHVRASLAGAAVAAGGQMLEEEKARAAQQQQQQPGR